MYMYVSRGMYLCMCLCIIYESIYLCLIYVCMYVGDAWVHQNILHVCGSIWSIHIYYLYIFVYVDILFYFFEDRDALGLIEVNTLY